MAAPPVINQVAIEEVADDAKPPRSRRTASTPKRAPPTVKAAASRKRGSPDIDVAAGRSRAARPNQRRRRKRPEPAQTRA
jgi:hypothetical protein